MKCKLGDYIRIKHGFAFKGEYITAENNGVVLVTPGNFEIGGGFKEDKCKFFNGDYPKEYVLSPYDLIVTMTDLSKQGDTLGYSALVPKTNRVYLHNQRIGLVDVYNPKADKMFIYWLMRTQKYQKTIVATSSGSTVKHTSPSRIYDVEVDLPPIDVQKKIAAILSALDEKIAINRAINDNLQQQAKAIFSKEFLTLETLPIGWERASLIDIADYLNGLAMQKYRPTADETGIPVLKIKELRQGCCDDNSELCSPNIKSEYIIHDGDVIFSWSGSLLVDFWCGGICGLNQHYLTAIDHMFRASDYLVSPLNTPDKFINGEYFLTPAQEQIQRKIIKDTLGHSGYGFFSLTGKPGTGKTLLLYDVAKQLSAINKTLVIHCGKLSKGQERLNESIKNFHVIVAGYLKYHPEIIRSYNFILVDETHRIYPKHYDEICDLVMRDNKICIFSSDPEQVLSSAEKRNGIVQKINSLPLIDKYELSEKIRTNKELASFIISVRNLNKKPHIPMDYGNVILSYANNYEEACNMIEYFKKQGYVFINYSKSNYNYSPYAKYEEDFDTHHVIGQEFDNVLMLMDDSFYYDENGVLQGVPHPNPDYLYPNLFYQGITRVREKIALVIVNSPRLFEKISSIFDIEQEA